jgi:hypothetical protein
MPSQRTQRFKEELAAARAYLNRVLDQVDDRWDVQVYTDGAAWNVHQLVIHLAISDRGQNNQIMQYAEGNEVIPADFDLDRYNKRSVEKRAELSPDEARASLESSRAELVAWLDTVEDAKLDKLGRHASLRVLSVTELLREMVNHERQHTADIARVLNIRA